MPGEAVFTAAFGTPLTPTYKIIADGDGRFITPPLPVGFAGITVRVPGQRTPWLRVPVGPAGRAELPRIRLEPSQSIMGVVSDENGQPLPSAKVDACAWDDGPVWLQFDHVTTDAHGRFGLDGLGRKTQLWVSAPNHVGLNWVLRRSGEGIRWAPVRDWDGEARMLQGPAPALTLTLHSVAWISGRAIDAESGQPVHLDRIVRCAFDRKANGEIVLNGCQSPEFEQEADGSFRLPYEVPDEYHLTLSADGYQDTEAFTPPVARLQPVDGIVVRMRKVSSAARTQVAKQSIQGSVTCDGRSVKSAWVALRSVRRQPNRANVAICCGRTITSEGNIIATAAVCDGTYCLNVPYQRDDWIVEVELPGRRRTQIANVSIALNENKRLDIAYPRCGSISGHLKGIAPAWANDTQVVAFTRIGLHFETPVGPDGSFCFRQLPPANTD